MLVGAPIQPDMTHPKSQLLSWVLWVGPAWPTHKSYPHIFYVCCSLDLPGVPQVLAIIFPRQSYVAKEFTKVL